MILRATLAAALCASGIAHADVSAPRLRDASQVLEEALGCPRPPGLTSYGEITFRLYRNMPENAPEREYDLAVWLRRHGRAMEAQDHLVEVLRLAPDTPLVPDIYLMHGDFFERQGDTEMALRFFERAAARAQRGPCADYAHYRGGRLGLLLGHERARPELEQLAQDPHVAPLLARAARAALAR